MNAWNPEAWLKMQHTRVLLQMRVSCYRCGGYNYYEHGGTTDAETLYDVFDDNRCFVSLGQIKTELATREHVPNKKEARALRQEQARRRSR